MQECLASIGGVMRLQWLVIAVLGVALLMLFGLPPAPATAQGSMFCAPGQTFENGFCVNVAGSSNLNPPPSPTCPLGWGPVAFGPTVACVGLATAALQSQSLDVTTRSMNGSLLAQTLDTVRARREEEAAPCPGGSRRVNGVCRAVSQPLQYAPEQAYDADISPGWMMLKAPPAAPVSAVARPAVWLQALGDREERSESTTTTMPALQGTPGTLLTPVGPGQVLSFSTSLGRVTKTGGFLGGVDFTIPNGPDVLLLGLVTGYLSAHVDYSNSANTADIFGPSVGIYGAYAHGPFSVDGALNVNFLTMNQAFFEFTGTNFAVSGSSSTRVNNYSAAANLNYRIPLTRAWYVEPTAGTSYIRAVYDSGAAALGLSDSSDWRLQGGARLGTNWTWGSVGVTSILTGLLYSDVSVTGGAAIQNGFAGTIVPTDEGKLFGQVLWDSIFDLGRGFSASTGADVRFRTGVFGVGGRAGLRYQW